MAFRRALAIVGALAFTAALATPSFAQDKRKLSKDETTQYEAIHALVDAVSAGKQPAPSDFKLAFHSDFIKSSDDVYIPYTLDVEPGKLASVPAAMYTRAVAKNPAPAAVPGAKPSGKGKVSSNAPASGSTTYAWEDITFVTPSAGNTIQRALALPAGDYDVYVAITEKPSKDKKAPPPKSTVLLQTLSVPNLFAGLSTSSIILAKNIEVSNEQLNGQQQLEQPYTLSGYKVTPALSSTIPKSGELLWLFYIYNEGAAAAGKPDLLVEYNFFRAGEEKPFVNMPSSSYNATTMQPEFNLALGHTLFVAQGVPLKSFNPGDYKMEIKMTDKTNSQSITRAVNFTVTE